MAPRLALLSKASDVHTVKWARHFQRRGYQVSVLSLVPGEIPDVEVIHLRPRGASKLWYLGTLPALRAALQRLQPDIVHAHYASSYGLLAALSGFEPVVISVWGSDVYEFPETSPLHAMTLRRVLRRARVICSTSYAMADHTARIVGKPESQICVTPFGVDLENFSYSEPSGVPVVIGVVKKLEPKYGIDVLLRAFAIVLSRARVPVRLQITGDGTQRGNLEQLASQLGLGQSVTFTGAVPHRDVPKVLETFKIFVVPSVSHSESFGVAAVEASASGLPVVASRIGGLPEVVVDSINGLLVPARDPAALAEALLRLTHDERLRCDLGRRGREFVALKYEWKANAALMEQIYDRLLEAGHSTTNRVA